MLDNFCTGPLCSEPLCSGIVRQWQNVDAANSKEIHLLKPGDGAEWRWWGGEGGEGECREKSRKRGRGRDGRGGEGAREWRRMPVTIAFNSASMVSKSPC